MARGRPRKLPPNVPQHIAKDYHKLPTNLYWDPSGSGRWYVRDKHPDGFGVKTTVVAGPHARLSDLFAIMEQRSGRNAAGSVGALIEAYEDSTTFKGLASITQKDYTRYGKSLGDIKTKSGAAFTTLIADKLTTAIIQRLVESIAKGKPASKPGADDAIRGMPSKANHLKRYLSLLFAWGRQHGHCLTNPAEGVAGAKERKQHNMPERVAMLAVINFAYQRGLLQSRAKGSGPPYLAPLMTIAYACRLRGIEALTLTDANEHAEGILTNRRKGSRDNIVRWTPELKAAWTTAKELRAKILSSKRNKGKPVPMKPELRPIFIAEGGEQLSKDGLDTAWQKMIKAAILQKVITEDQRFSLHGLKHRGITDTKGNRADKQQSSGHKDSKMLDIYDHEIPVVESAKLLDFSGDFSGAANSEKKPGQ
ncbi:hypothetical protein ABB27_14755 [Stenotrophomonas terrae]|uniref:Integrase n=1 Tax=Stenotrophomonas terrae TaxID=405446 RepID=A0A0R0C844_9GAMM|nr:integrase [Stenotrophomonas terrae]KRG65821.1 hypothetical protein ABB27_14755 [Stenotrophomonas terrae]